MVFFLSMQAWTSFIINTSIEDGANFIGSNQDDILFRGCLGTFFGVPIYTDAFVTLNVTQDEEVFLIPKNKIKYFVDEFQPLLSDGYESSGDEVLKLAGSTVLNSVDELNDFLHEKAKVLLPQKRAELETYQKFHSVMEALDFLKGCPPQED